MCAYVCVCVCVCVCVVREGGGGVSACTCAWLCSDDPSDGYCGRRNTEYPALSNALSLRDDVHLEDFMPDTL